MFAVTVEGVGVIRGALMQSCYDFFCARKHIYIYTGKEGGKQGAPKSKSTETSSQEL